MRAFPQRIFLDMLEELGHHSLVPAERHGRLETSLGRLQLQLREALPLGSHSRSMSGSPRHSAGAASYSAKASAGFALATRGAAGRVPGGDGQAPQHPQYAALEARLGIQEDKQLGDPPTASLGREVQ